MSVKIGVILGSSRPQRAGETVAKWFTSEAKNTDDFIFEFIDLAKINLPMFDEPIPPLMNQYQNEHTKEWSEKINSLDGFIVLTPEYNHSFPAVLKNALDYLNHEWNKKPIGFVSYGAASGGLRAVEQLRLVAVELQMVPVKEQIMIGNIWEAFENGKPKESLIKGRVQSLIDEVVWWAKLLKGAR